MPALLEELAASCTFRRLWAPWLKRLCAIRTSGMSGRPLIPSPKLDLDLDALLTRKIREGHEKLAFRGRSERP